MNSYDDARYLEWCQEFKSLIAEYLDTEGNDEHTLRDEFEEAMEDAR